MSHSGGIRNNVLSETFLAKTGARLFLRLREYIIRQRRREKIWDETWNGSWMYTVIF